MDADVIGAVELSSIAAGILAVDAMVKAAPVEILRTCIVCPGKYLILITGDVASVEASLEAGRRAAQAHLLDTLFIPNLSPCVIPAIRGGTAPRPLGGEEALGVVESATALGGVAAADVAAKEADVRLVEVRLADEMGGKSYVKMAGRVGDVEASVQAATGYLEARGALCHRVVVPNPHPEIGPFVIRDRTQERNPWR